MVKREIWRLWLKERLMIAGLATGSRWRLGWLKWWWGLAAVAMACGCFDGWEGLCTWLGSMKTREKRLPMETSCSWDSDGVFLSTTLWGTRTGFRVDWVWFFWVSLARNRLLVSVSCRREKVLVLDYFMRAVLRLVEMEEWNWVLMTFEGNERWSLCVVDLSCGVGGYWVGWFAWRLVVL